MSENKENQILAMRRRVQGSQATTKALLAWATELIKTHRQPGTETPERQVRRLENFINAMSSTNALRQHRCSAGKLLGGIPGSAPNAAVTSINIQVNGRVTFTAEGILQGGHLVRSTYEIAGLGYSSLRELSAIRISNPMRIGPTVILPAIVITFSGGTESIVPVWQRVTSNSGTSWVPEDTLGSSVPSFTWPPAGQIAARLISQSIASPFDANGFMSNSTAISIPPLSFMSTDSQRNKTRQVLLDEINSIMSITPINQGYTMPPAESYDKVSSKEYWETIGGVLKEPRPPVPYVTSPTTTTPTTTTTTTTTIAGDSDLHIAALQSEITVLQARIMELEGSAAQDKIHRECLISELQEVHKHELYLAFIATEIATTAGLSVPPEVRELAEFYKNIERPAAAAEELPKAKDLGGQLMEEAGLGRRPVRIDPNPDGFEEP